ncbi:MAG: 4-hydroxy-tetrahydrodipicolinate synthase [Bacteroidales bacterium]|nr:4-hydroxy-tetrahydrodipicolinate synthase [Bacteroidales bacterium]
MALTHQFTGTGVAMVTPFNQVGEVDFDRLILHTDRLIKNGINYLVVLGTTAETPTLSASEKSDVVRCVVDACGSRVPIIVGAGGNDTRSVVELVKSMDLNGVNGLLSVAPYYNKPSQEGMYQHFAALAAVADLPVMLYNVPGRTGSNISAETVLRLANDFHGTIVAVKEASGDFEQVMDIIEKKPEDFLVVSGDDSITLPMIAIGGDGVVSVIGNAYPALFSTMVSAALDGSFEKARELHYKLSSMMKAIFKEGNPAGVKASMEIQGWMENVLRLPLVPATGKLYQEIRDLDSKLH